MTSFEEAITFQERALDLELARIDRDFQYAYGMESISMENEMLESVMFEAEDGSSEGFLSRMINSVLQFIRDLASSVRDAFSKSEHMDVDRYLSTSTGQMQLAYDCKAIEEEVDDQILKGRKYIQKLSNHLPVSDKEVANFVDGCGSVVERHGGAVLRHVGIGAYRKWLTNNSFKNVDKGLSGLLSDARGYKVMTKQEEIQHQKAQKEQKRVGRIIKRKERTYRVLDKVSGSAAASYAQRQREKYKEQQITSAVCKMSKGAASAYAKVSSQIDAEMRKISKGAYKGYR